MAEKKRGLMGDLIEGVKLMPGEVKSMFASKKAARSASPPARPNRQFTSEEDIENALRNRGKLLKEVAADPNSYKKGGKVKKTGIAKVHKGERVLTVAQTKKFEKPVAKKATPKKNCKK